MCKQQNPNLKKIVVELAALQDVNASQVVDLVFPRNVFTAIVSVLPIATEVLQEVEVGDGLVQLVGRRHRDLFRKPPIEQSVFELHHLWRVDAELLGGFACWRQT